MRVAIVNDLPMAVEALRRVIGQAPELQLAWIAGDGAEAVERCARDRPELILMDLLMPVMDGVEATRRIMQASPCAILVVTATVEGNRNKVFDALGNGALDAVNTPVLGASGQTGGGSALLAKIRTIGKLIQPVSPVPLPVVAVAPAAVQGAQPTLIAIGASTGGPAALAQLLSALPASLPAAVVVVQHVDEQFAAGLADWLDRQSPLAVRLALAGDRPEQGTVSIAASNDHLRLGAGGSFAYTAEPLDNPYRPSLDVLFASAAEHWPGPGIAVTLTGMGRDGAEGMLQLRRAGWHTIAQDEATSLIFGMPRACIEAGAACQVIPLADIAGALQQQLTRLLTERSTTRC